MYPITHRNKFKSDNLIKEVAIQDETRILYFPSSSFTRCASHALNKIHNYIINRN